MKTAKQILIARNPQHETNLDTGRDMFYETMELCMEEYANQYKEKLDKAVLILEDCKRVLALNGFAYAENIRDFLKEIKHE